MNLEESIENSIFNHVGKIKNIEKIKKAIIESENDSKSNSVKIKVETKRLCGYDFPFLDKTIHTLEYEKSTILKILDSAIKEEQELINKCIDMEIDLRIRRIKNNECR